MSLRYKIDVLAALKAAGYNTTTLRKKKLLAESTIQKIRNGEMISPSNIDVLCRLLNCQPGDIMEYEADTKEEGA